MAPMNDRSTYAKEAALWALANQNPEFQEFYERCQKEMSITAPLPDGFVDNVISVVEEDPALGPTAKKYVANARNVGSFSGVGIAAVSIICATLFLLKTDIKYEKSSDGKWEFRFAHHSVKDDVLKPIVEALSKISNKS